MSLCIVASGAVAPLTSQQKEGKTGAGIVEIRPQENTFKDKGPAARLSIVCVK